VLAYTAAALPTLLSLTQSVLAVGEVLTTETLAVEIVQTLVGSIGLVASVPFTTALASWVVTLSGRDDPRRALRALVAPTRRSRTSPRRVLGTAMRSSGHELTRHDVRGA